MSQLQPVGMAVRKFQLVVDESPLPRFLTPHLRSQIGYRLSFEPNRSSAGHAFKRLNKSMYSIFQDAVCHVIILADE